MPEFAPVTTLVDVESLDSAEVMCGYHHGVANGAEPGSWASRSFWHGWRRGRVDAGHVEQAPDQSLLAYLWHSAFADKFPSIH